MYCDNNTINGIDRDGLEMNPAHPFVMTHAMGIKDTGGGGGGGLVIAGVTWLSKVWSKAVSVVGQLTLLLFPTAAYVSELVDVEATVAPTPRPNPTPSPKSTPAPTPTPTAAVYWGAAIEGASWGLVTPPMTLMEAVAWAYTTGEMHKYGNRRSWGIYTPKQSDAISIATILYATDNFIQDTGGAGQYDHYHSPDRLFMEKYRHFHIWYGTLR